MAKRSGPIPGKPEEVSGGILDTPAEQLQQNLEREAAKSVSSDDVNMFATLATDLSRQEPMIPEEEIQPTQEEVLGPANVEQVFGMDVDKIDLETSDEDLNRMMEADPRLYEMDLFQRAERVRQEEEEGRNTRRYNTHIPNFSEEENGGFYNRANVFADTVITGESIRPSGVFHPKPVVTGVGQMTHENKLGNIGSLVTKMQATYVDPNTGKQNLNRDFLFISSLVTEDFLADDVLGETRAEKEKERKALQDFAKRGEYLTREDVFEETDTRSSVDNFTITKSRGNAALGGRIASEWSKYSGVKTDLTREELELLGDSTKELYYEINKGSDEQPYIIRHDKDNNRSQVYYEVTPLGQAMFKQSAVTRKMHFPAQHVDPLTTSMSETQPPTTSEQRKKKVRYSGERKKIDEPLDNEVLLQAKSNLEAVPHYVIPRREKLVFSTLLVGLAGEAMTNVPKEIVEMSSEINGFGASKDREFKARLNIARKKGERYSPDDNMNELKKSISQSLYGISKNRKKKVYLTYMIQAFNGRLTPEQTHFNPTTSKQIRFVTGHPVPVTFKPGTNSRQEVALREMYAMMLLKFPVLNEVTGETRMKDVGDLLPLERLARFKESLPALAKFGKRIKDALVMTDEDANNIADAIKQGLPMDHPNFPIASVKALNFDAANDKRIIDAIADKGEDGLALLDGLIDVYEYHRALENNLDKSKTPIQFSTHFNAYIDGKTNGLAANAMQLGIQELAYRVGALRKDATISNKSIYALDNNIDIRDDLASRLTAYIDQAGFQDSIIKSFGANKYKNIDLIIRRLFNTRNLNKATTMTFGYGKELMGFIQDLKDFLDLNAVNDPEVADSLEILRSGWYPGKDKGVSIEDYLIEKIAFPIYQNKLVEVITPRGIEARQLMYQAAMYHVMFDELFEINGPTGFPLRFGGMESLGASESESTAYDIYGYDETGKLTSQGRKAYHYATRPTSAAIRQTMQGPYIGGYAVGAASPGPVQSIDAATVALSVTGKSWADLMNDSNGSGYIHSIYDAFKFDANGFTNGVKNVNQNWLDINFGWSYLKETQKSFEAAKKSFYDKLKVPDDAEVSVGMESGFRKIGELLKVEYTKDGDPYRPALISFIRKVVPVGVPAEVTEGIVADIENVWAGIGISQTTSPTVLTAKDVKKIVNSLLDATKFESKFKKLIKESEADKMELKALIERNVRDGEIIAQYYAH